jgi:hypothetical protein
VEGCCENGNEFSGSKNFGKFLSSFAIGCFQITGQLHEVVSYAPCTRIHDFVKNCFTKIFNAHLKLMAVVT